MLQSPDTTLRLRAYRSLFVNPLPAAVPLVLQEALNPASPLRRDALSVLGILHDPAVLPALRPLLDEASPRIASSAMKTLIRLGEALPDEKVLACWRCWPDPADRIEVLTGLSSCKRIQTLWQLLHADLAAGVPNASLRLVMLHLADALGERAEICEIWTADAQVPGSGQAYVLGELGEQPAWADLAVPGSDRVAWRGRVAARLDGPAIPDDLTAASLLFLATRPGNRPS